MADATKRGFEIGSQFYPVVPVDQWRHGDFVLAREVTRLTAEELFGPDSDFVTVQQALLGVAIWHERPSMRLEKIVDVVYALKPSDVAEVGFDDEGDAGPPDEGPAKQQPSGSSKISDEGTAAEPVS